MKFFREYVEFLNEDLTRETPKLFQKMSAYTLMHLAIWRKAYKHFVRKTNGVVKYTFMENDSVLLKHSMEKVNEILYDFSLRFKDIFDSNVKLLAHSTGIIDGISNREVTDILKKYKSFYVFWDTSSSTGKHDGFLFYYIIATNYKNVRTIRKDEFFDPSTTLYGTVTISKITAEKVEDLLVDSEIAGQSLVDKVWSRRIEKDPLKFKEGEEFISKKLKDKYQDIDTSLDIGDF